MEVSPVFFAVLGTLTIATASTTPPPVQGSTTSIPATDRSVLFNILDVLGFSDTCLATALDTCAPVPQDSELVTLLKETRDLLQNVAEVVNKTQNPPRHCKDLQDGGDAESGIRVIHPYPGQPDRRLRVYCDQTTDGGGWTVFQQRKNVTVREDFYRTWSEYQLGFGNLEGEFWLGLDPLHALTVTGLQELRIDLADWEGGQRYAKYGYFHILGLEAKYRLHVGRYSGTALDSLNTVHHSGQPFSTHDSDNDRFSGNCAESFRGAWWYGECHNSNLNGYQHVGTHSTHADGINWGSWRGHYYSLRKTAMMVRPAY